MISHFDLIKSVEINWCLHNGTITMQNVYAFFLLLFVKCAKTKDKLPLLKPNAIDTYKNRTYGISTDIIIICFMLKCKFNHLIYWSGFFCSLLFALNHIMLMRNRGLCIINLSILHRRTFHSHDSLISFEYLIIHIQNETVNKRFVLHRTTV